MISFLQRIGRLRIVVFVVVSVCLSELLTSLMSILLQGRITTDYLVTGGFVSVIVSGIVVYFMNRLFGLTLENETLQKEILSRRQAEEKLCLNEERLQLAMAVTRQGWFDVNVQTGEIVVSPEYVRLIGYEPAGFKTDLQNWIACLHPEDRDAVLKAFREGLETNDTRTMEYRRRTRTGEWKWIRSIGKIVESDAQGRPLRVIGTHADISDRKRAEEDLGKSEERYRLLMETSPSAITVSDIWGNIFLVNHRALGIFGHLDVDEALGRSIFEWVPEEEKARASNAFARVLEGQLLDNFEIRLLKGNGESFWGSINASVVRDGEGIPQLITVVTTDVTERKRLEEEIIKTQKLEAIGTLAGGIAHDFNNLLQGVFGYISLAKMRSDDREKSLAALEEAEKALHRSVRLTAQLLTFSKGGKPVKKLVDLRPVIEDAATFALTGSRASCRIVADDGLWRAEADEGQIGQVVQNIVLNADQAMPEGGEVEITARNVKVPWTCNPRGLQNGKYVEIGIRDSGIGIPEQYLGKIFDPYFTTKEKGSGLGLATSYSIMKNHGGVIECKSEMGKGTSFFLYVPATATANKEEPPKAAAAAVLGKSGKILVMDDEALVRNIAREMIESLGHEVELAENGQEAIASYGESLRSGVRFDVVILDLTIRGGMGGEEAMRELLKMDPGIRAVVSSGYADSAAISDYEARGFKAGLKKPYDITELSDTLNSLLQ